MALSTAMTLFLASVALSAESGEPDDTVLTEAEVAQSVLQSDPMIESRIWRLRAPTGEDFVSWDGDEGPLYRAGDVATDTKLPVGYPRPTPPGAIEIKHYASVRQAEVSGSNSFLSSQRGFMPLFRHIQRNNIAMTAPVEMRYADDDQDGDTDSWTMAFLYHTTENGPTGSDGNIVIIDTKPVTVVSLGVQGQRSPESTAQLLGELEAWLDHHSDHWQRRGDARVLGYNGPYTPVRDRWWEVQIPIEAVKPAGPQNEADAPAEPAAEQELL